MLKNLEELLQTAREKPAARMAVAAAADVEVLQAVKLACSDVIIEPLLVGEKGAILEAAREADLEVEESWIFDCSEPEEIAARTMQLVSEGQADFLMKGLISTSALLRALLSKEYGLRREGLLSHLSLMEVGRERLIIMTDGAMNIAPDLEKKAEIIANAAEVAHKLGLEKPRVAALAAVEKVNPDMPATLEAAALSKMADRGQIKGVVVDGPLALDNAVDEKAARYKGIDSPVAGKADILLMPDIEAGNIFYKAMIYLGGYRGASIVVGARVPVVLTSRADDARTKLVSIALGKMAI